MANQRELKRMAVIAREYPYINGLADAWLGLVFTGIGAWALALGWSWWFLLAFFLLAALGERVVRKYHVGRFGRVKGENIFAKYAWATGAVYGLLAMFDAKYRGQGVPSVAMLVWAIGPIRDVVGGWPYRNYHVANVIAVLLGSVAHVSVRSPDDQAVWFAQLALIWGIAHVMTGFCDHQLLTSVLRANHEAEETADETAL